MNKAKKPLVEFKAWMRVCSREEVSPDMLHPSRAEARGWKCRECKVKRVLVTVREVE